ncbi:MAG: ABC transporter ATP-binding protein [Wolinella sp.]
MIELSGVHKSFGEKAVLKGVSFVAPEAKTTVVFGLSGGGKSTIIKLIVRLLECDSGDIKINGESIVKAPQKRLYELRKEIGFLFQSGALFDSKNVYENVAFPLREHMRLSECEIREKVLSRLEMVGLRPDEVSKLFPDELSGGMKKRVGLARSLILDPKVILYDEPTSGLDPITSDHITQMIIRLQRELKTTSILISHDLKESFKAGDYMAMLYDGQIIEYGDRNSFANSEDPRVKQFLAGSSEGVIRLK